MKSLKAIKKLLKQNNQWKEYKTKYAHKQMRLVSSKVALIYNKNISIEEMYKLEVKALEAKKSDEENMFKNVYAEFNSLIRRENIDWKAFSKYMWFAYQTSTYWKDVKKGRDNAFNTRNYISLNQIKRSHYDKWVKSIDLSIEGANDRLMKVQKAVF